MEGAGAGWVVSRVLAGGWRRGMIFGRSIIRACAKRSVIRIFLRRLKGGKRFGLVFWLEIIIYLVAVCNVK